MLMTAESTRSEVAHDLACCICCLLETGMAYQSRIYSTTFRYDPFDDTADNFNSRLGRVLNEGAYSVRLKLFACS